MFLFLGYQGSDGRTGVSRESHKLPHYYDLIEKTLDSSNYDQESLAGTEEGNVYLEPEVSDYYKLLEGATRDQDNINGHETKALEKFDFSDYQICSNSFEGHSTQDCGKDTVTDVELKLNDL